MSGDVNRLLGWIWHTSWIHPSSLLNVRCRHEPSLDFAVPVNVYSRVHPPSPRLVMLLLWLAHKTLLHNIVSSSHIFQLIASKIRPSGLGKLGTQFDLVPPDSHMRFHLI